MADEPGEDSRRWYHGIGLVVRGYRRSRKARTLAGSRYHYGPCCLAHLLHGAMMFAVLSTASRQIRLERRGECGPDQQETEGDGEKESEETPHSNRV